MGFMNSLNKWKEQAPDSKTTNAINAMPGQEAPKFGTETTPQLNQLPMYHDGGDIPKDQVAKLSEGERVLNPTETHAYKSAAVGNAPSTMLGRISDRAHELYQQSQSLTAPLSSEAEAIKQKQQTINAATRPLQPTAPVQAAPVAPVAVDKINSNAKYGNRPGEQRIDTSDMLKPLGSTATPIGNKLPSYDEGGDVPADQVAKVHEDEHVLDPEKAAAYRQAEKEIKAEEKGAPADFGGQVMPNPKGIEVKADTDQEKPDYKLQGAKMNVDNAPIAEPPLNMDNSHSDIGGPHVEEAKTPLGSKVAPQGSEMKRLPGFIGDTNAELTESVKNGTVEIPKAPPTPEEIIKQDKMDAMKSGDLVKLGMAHINERSLKSGSLPALPAPTAPTARENVVNQEKDLRNKMINGATEQERFQAEKDLAELKRRTPWGSEGSAHPGILGKIGHAASSIAQGAAQGVAPYVLPAIPGSKANLAEQEARGEQGVEQAQAKDMETAKIAEEKNMPEVARQRADIAQQSADIKQQEADTKQERVESQEVLDTAKSNAQNAIAELKKAQADPNNPQSQAILAKFKNDARKVDIAAGKLGLDGDRYKAEYLGVDHEGNPLAGGEVDANGKPVGIKVGKSNEPSAQQLNKANLAHNVQENIFKAKALIDKNPDLFGKAAGRITTFEQLMGSDDPSIGQIQTIVYNVGLAAGGIHSQRGLAAAQHAATLLLNGFKNGPEATKAALDEMSGSVQTFIDDARAGKKIVHHASEVNPAGGTPTAPGTPAGETPFQKWQRENKKQ